VLSVVLLNVECSWPRHDVFQKNTQHSTLNMLWMPK
jgi:hypothetical protein